MMPHCSRNRRRGAECARRNTHQCPPAPKEAPAVSATGLRYHVAGIALPARASLALTRLVTQHPVRQCAYSLKNMRPSTCTETEPHSDHASQGQAANPLVEAVPCLHQPPHALGFSPAPCVSLRCHRLKPWSLPVPAMHGCYDPEQTCTSKLANSLLQKLQEVLSS